MAQRTYPTIRAFVESYPLYTPNRYTGRCFACGKLVEKGKGHVVKIVRNRKATYRMGHLPVVGHCDAHTKEEEN